MLLPKGVFYLRQNGLGFSGELRFWTQIMGDHARFIKNSLHPDRTNLNLIADNFMQIFDRFYEKVAPADGVKQPNSLIEDINTAVISLREFKRELLAARLQNLPVTSLDPAFYNHMLNELDDFLKVLSVYQSGKVFEESILGEHLLWVLDAAGHAAILNGDLDKVEYKLQEETKLFETYFDQLYLKVVEITGYFRGNPPSAQPALERYNSEVAAAIQKFMSFLLELRQGVMKQQVLGRLVPLEPDHMWREACYYLLKISESTPGFTRPDCDPGRPRVMG
jgi:hypothetical protein